MSSSVKREREGLKEITTAKARWLSRCLNPVSVSGRLRKSNPIELLAVLKRVEPSGRQETAKRLLAFAGRVFRYAVATSAGRRNIAADLQGALTSPKVKHHAAIIEPKGVGGLLRAIDGFDGHPATIWALRLAPHVFVRPGELRMAEWSEIDLEGPYGASRQSR